MQNKTDLQKIKEVVKTFLMFDVKTSKFSPMVVHHPFTGSGIVAVNENGEMKVIDITKNDENLSLWQNRMREQIDKAKNTYEIFIIANKPYKLTLLKYCMPH